MHATEGRSNDDTAPPDTDYKVFGREDASPAFDEVAVPAAPRARGFADDPFAGPLTEPVVPEAPEPEQVAPEPHAATTPGPEAASPWALAPSAAPEPSTAITAPPTGAAPTGEVAAPVGAAPTELRPEWFRDPACWVHLLPIAGSVLILTGFGLVPALLIENTAGKRDEFVRDQAREALNFQLNLALINLVALVVFWLAPFVWPFTLAFGVVLPIQAALDVHKGRRHRYPIVPRWLD